MSGLFDMAEVGSLWRTRGGKCVVLVKIDPDDPSWPYVVDRDDWPDYDVATSSYGVSADGIQWTSGEHSKWDVVEPWGSEPVDAKAANIHKQVMAGEYRRIR